MVEQHSYDYHIRRGKIPDTFIVFIGIEGAHPTIFCHKFVSDLNCRVSIEFSFCLNLN